MSAGARERLRRSNRTSPMDPHVRKAIDSVFARLHASGYRSLNEMQRTLLCVWTATGEIDNGGFEQFFFNTSGELVRRYSGRFHQARRPTSC